MRVQLNQRTEKNPICINCGSNTTFLRKTKKGTPTYVWYRYKDGYICQKCYCKLINNPRVNPVFQPRRITYKNKRVTLKENPRIGTCSQCMKSIGDDYINKYGNISTIKSTHMHHIIYIPIFVWFGTKELCPSCHLRTRTPNES